MHGQSAGIVHARRGSPAFVHLYRIRRGISRFGGKRFPVRDGTLGTGDAGIPSTMGPLARAVGIATRLRGDSEGARTEAGDSSRVRIQRGGWQIVRRQGEAR